MTEQDKQLLLQDLCGRLPYGVKCRMLKSDSQVCTLDSGLLDKVEILEPYLRPMSSMTDEEEGTLDSMCNGVEMVSRLSGLKMFDKAFGWLNANHFDYRGLIEKGLAIAVTEENNPYK